MYEIKKHIMKGERYKLLFIVLLIAIIYFSASIRLSPLPNLVDQTTGEYLPSALDPFYFLRASEHIIEGGSLSDTDNMRYLGAGPYSSELLSHTNVMLYKIALFSGVDITFKYINVISPVIYFILALIIFYFLMIRLLQSRYAAIISTALLAFTPLFLNRTAAGFSDHEAIGVLFFFISLYFLTDFLYNEKYNWKIGLRKFVLFPLSMALTIYAWGGIARLLFIIYPMFFLLINIRAVLYNRFLGYPNMNDEYYYLRYFMITFASLCIFMFIFSPNGLPYMSFFSGYVMSYTGIILQFMSVYALISYIIYATPASKYIEDKMKAIWAFGTTVSLGVLFMIFTGKLWSMIKFIQSPLIKSRIGQTVAENQAVSLLNLQAHVGVFFYAMFILGAVMILYPFVSRLIVKKSLAYTTKRDMLYLTLLIVSIYSFNSSIRLMFINSIFLSIFTGIVIAKSLRSYYNISDSATKMLAVSILILVIVTSFFSIYSFYVMSSLQVKGIGPSANSDWQNAMEWVRTNTPKDSLFIHWWDYGYWIQSLGERATVTDGGHASTYWDHLIGRYLLTTPNEQSAFEMFNTYGVDYLLIDSSDIGKYPAYSSIGDNEPDTDDRTSYIGQFLKDERYTQETNNTITLIYNGQLVLDEDYIENNYLLQSYKSAIVQLQIKYDTNGTFKSITGIATDSRGTPVYIPIRYMYIDGKLYDFGIGYEGIVRFVTSYNNGKTDVLGGALVLSPRVKQSFMARAYILDEYVNTNKLDIVYQAPTYGPDKFLFVNGRLIGPITIFEIKDNEYGINPGYLNMSGKYSAFDDLYYSREDL